MPSTISPSSPPDLNTTGIGLRPVHYQQLLETLPAVGWLEVHSENYLGDGGVPLHYLELARNHYPLSLHGIGLSLGSTDALNMEYLKQIKDLVKRFEPQFISDHLCWCSFDNVYFNDLLPLPYTEEALNNFVERVDTVQQFLGREILVENPTGYMQFRHSTISEHDFLAEIANRSGCGLLLDVNNVYVNSMNHGINAKEFIDALPAERIREIHLAGHTVSHYPEGDVYIDSHDTKVCDAVWSLYEYTLQSVGNRPTLIEWDADIPALDVLLSEAARADNIRENSHAHAA